MNTTSPISKLAALASGMIWISSAHAQNANFAPGDLVLFFQKPGNNNTLYVGLGNAATGFRGTASGPTDDRQALNLVNINTELTDAFGSGWATDPEIYAGLVAARSNSTGTQVVDGDPTRTLYVSSPRSPLGSPGAAGSNGWDLSLSNPFTAGATQIAAFGNTFETNYTTRAAVSPVNVSTIDDQNPFLAPGLQDTAFKAFAGGVQQAGAAGTLGNFAPAGQVEFALDLYRILPRTTGTNSDQIISGPDKTGSYEGTVVVSASGSVSFITQAAVASPEITVESTDTTPSTDITSGQTLDFGTVNPGESGAAANLMIKNPGDADLTGITLSVTGTNASEFEISTLAGDSLSQNGSTAFTITFNPSSGGTKSAVLHIASNDPDENPFDIALAGNAPFPAPEIRIDNSSNVELADGSAGSAQNFSRVLIGKSSRVRTFTIHNTGNADLTGLAVSVAGTHTSDFIITQPSGTTLAPNETATFTVAFKPRAAGTRSAVVRIASIDADESPFDLSVRGTGLVPAPEIDIQQPAGSSQVDGSAKRAFGTVKVSAQKGKSLTFTIKNTGTAPLTKLSTAIGGTHKNDFTATKPKLANLAPGASTTFTVTFKPSAKGTRKAALKVSSNDANENPFDIQLTGMGS